MEFIIGKDRKQAALFPVSLKESIEIENEVRAIDIFVNSLDLEKMGFKVHFPEGGRPAYHPAVLLKLYIYGYLNRMRPPGSWRRIRRNIEMMWLIEQLSPDHNTIANFRKDNPDAIKRGLSCDSTTGQKLELELDPTSPGYRLFLNNVLFPAPKKNCRRLK